ncbi:MAG TPA: ChaN family lipoprotein [Burkholderiales bacterium]|nr:ChaN family lipoprotein [Burkholderiales bacterium]
MLLSDHPLAGTIWDARAGSSASQETLHSALRAARYRLLGEVHDNPDHHAFQLECLIALGESGLRPAVAFEQLDREYDSALQRLLAAGGATAEAVANTTNFDRENWGWDHYGPLIDAALRYGMSLRAANLSRAAAGRVVKAGLDSLGEGRASALRIDAAWSEAREHVLREIIAEGHCRALPESLVPRMVLAQRARDATLAEALHDPGTDGAVLIAGNGHVRRDLGVPIYLRQARPGESIVSIGLLEVESGMTDPGEYLVDSAGGEAQYDFVWFTPRWDRPDPCEKLKPR